MELSILIISFNTRDVLLDCLASLEHLRTREAQYEILVVDNASTDGSAEAVEERFPHVKLFRLAKNIGFAAANNLAATRAEGRYLLLLNPDTVVEEGAIERALTFAGEHEPVIVGGRTFFGDGTLNRTSCHGWPTLWSVTCQGLGLSTLFRRSGLFNPEGLGRWKRDSVRSVPVVTGCFLLVRRDHWEMLGGFDEDFFMYGEETDLCMRAARAGIGRLICPEARLVHYGGASERVRADKMVRLFSAKAMLYRKHWGPVGAAYGVAMLRFWAWNRMVGHLLLGCVGRGPGRDSSWGEIWNRRSEFAQIAQLSPPSAARLRSAEG